MILQGTKYIYIVIIDAIYYVIGVLSLWVTNFALAVMTSFKNRAQLMNFTTFLELFFDERFIVDITKLKIRVLKIRELVFNVSCNCTDKRDFGCILGKSRYLILEYRQGLKTFWQYYYFRSSRQNTINIK